MFVLRFQNFEDLNDSSDRRSLGNDRDANFSHRVRRVTSHLIFHRGRLGMRLFGTTNSGISTFRVSCLETIPFFEFCKGT